MLKFYSPCGVKIEIGSCGNWGECFDDGELKVTDELRTEEFIGTII